MVGTCSQRCRNDRGAAAVEFALVVPILLTLVFGIVDFGLAINRYAVVNNAAREGVREASLGATESEIRTVVAKRMVNQQGTVIVTVACKKPDDKTTCTSWDAGQESGGLAEVTVDLTVDWITPVGRLVGEKFEVARTSKMRIE